MITPSNFFVTGSLTGAVPGSLSYNPASRTAKFTPTGVLDVANEIFTVTVKNDIKDLEYNGLDGNYNGIDEGGADDFTWTFGNVGDMVAPTVISASDAPDPISPDGDGTDDTSTFTVSYSDNVGVTMWQVRILSGGTLIKTIVKTAGTTAVWDGRDETGVVVDEGTYDYEVRAWDAAGNQSNVVSGTVEVESPIDILDFGP